MTTSGAFPRGGIARSEGSMTSRCIWVSNTSPPSESFSIALTTMPVPREELARDVEAEHHDDEHERGRPGERDLVVVRRGREVVDQHRQRCRGLHDVQPAEVQQPVTAEERGEEQ